MNSRSDMDSAIKRIVVPELRRAGFTGSFPHFRRLSQAVDLITFQFDRYGGGFVIEAATGNAAGFTTHWGKHIPANKLTARDFPFDQRKRLVPGAGSSTDSWFRFDGSASVDHVAADALQLLAREYHFAESAASPNGGSGTVSPSPEASEGPPSVS